MIDLVTASVDTINPQGADLIIRRSFEAQIVSLGLFLEGICNFSGNLKAVVVQEVV